MSARQRYRNGERNLHEKILDFISQTLINISVDAGRFSLIKRVDTGVLHLEITLVMILELILAEIWYIWKKEPGIFLRFPWFSR